MQSPPTGWTGLEINSQTGLPKATIDNVWIILENDPLLKGKFALNQFAGRGEVLDALPWNASTKRRLWDDNDNNGLYWYMEKVHHITGNGKIDGALSLHTTQHASTRSRTTSRASSGMACPAWTPFSLTTWERRTAPIPEL